MAEPQPRRGFGPTPEVTGYFERKGIVPAFKYLDVWGEEHAYNFMVSGSTELELTTAFRDSIANALRTGQSLENWKLAMREELARQGWLGPRVVADPTGREPDRIIDFSSGRRLKTIFWSNMNSARAAGQWERAQRTKKALPYFLYLRTTSKEPREEHLGWVGIILPVDHPFWTTHFPPNGWLCKCQVRQISAREAERLLGLAPVSGRASGRHAVPREDRLGRDGRTRRRYLHCPVILNRRRSGFGLRNDGHLSRRRLPRRHEEGGQRALRR